MNKPEFLDQFKGEEGTLYALSLGLLHSKPSCAKCFSSEKVKVQKNFESSDFRCFKCLQCKRRFSIRKGSFFSRSNLSIYQIMCILCDFVQDISIKTCSESYNLSEKTERIDIA